MATKQFILDQWRTNQQANVLQCMRALRSLINVPRDQNPRLSPVAPLVLIYFYNKGFSLQQICTPSAIDPLLNMLQPPQIVQEMERCDPSEWYFIVVYNQQTYEWIAFKEYYESRRNVFLPKLQAPPLIPQQDRQKAWLQQRELYRPLFAAWFGWQGAPLLEFQCIEGVLQFQRWVFAQDYLDYAPVAIAQQIRQSTGLIGFEFQFVLTIRQDGLEPLALHDVY